jgi:hypothetical protein
MSSHLVFCDRTLSRRRFMSGLAATAAASSTVVLVSTVVRAEAPEWQEYRDEEIGFRIELPGRISFKPETPLEGKGPLVRWTIADAKFDGMTLLVSATEHRSTPPADDIYELLRAGAPATGNLPSREEQRTVSGVPARDFIREADDVNYINRLVIVDNRVIGVCVLGDRSIHGNPTVFQILDSLALLRGGR